MLHSGLGDTLTELKLKGNSTKAGLVGLLARCNKILTLDASGLHSTVLTDSLIQAIIPSLNKRLHTIDLSGSKQLSALSIAALGERCCGL